MATKKKVNKGVSDDMVNGVAITLGICVIVTGIVYWLTTLA